ncbi:MAG: DUF4143 domain-containing protein, partial [Dehalococcoidia bacterium]|nr:DUF4143 domain-containing protein [Dehalococcoidia bacterium]
FVLTGSSARKLRRQGINLLAGRALTCRLHPLTAAELGEAFDLHHALRHGLLPSVGSEPDPARYLQSYVKTFLDEEIRQEGLARNLSAFARFLEAAAFSQGGVLNISEVARECAVGRKLVESHFGLLEDLMIASRLPVFTRRAKRRLSAHPKFYLFDAGVFTALRARGPLDSAAEIEGAAVETLMFQNLAAVNDALDLGYKLHYWRTTAGQEVDFILYGPRGLIAIEVKRDSRPRPEAFAGLKAFAADYPQARRILAYGGDRHYHADGIEVWPLAGILPRLPAVLQGEGARNNSPNIINP